MMFSLRRGVFVALIASVALWGSSLAIFSRGNIASPPPASLEGKLQDLATGYKLETFTEMPEDIIALAAAPAEYDSMLGKVFIGTTPVGGVHAINVMTKATTMTIAQGLGDYVRYGLCYVNSIAIKDLDRDGIPELLATTSQVVPRGRPRLYVWSLSNPVTLRSMSRSDIQSSWSHGLGFLERPDLSSLGTYVTYCGYGEIVEYQLKSGTDASGFAEERLGWKKVANRH